MGRTQPGTRRTALMDEQHRGYLNYTFHIQNVTKSGQNRPNNADFGQIDSRALTKLKV